LADNYIVDISNVIKEKGKRERERERTGKHDYCGFRIAIRRPDLGDSNGKEWKREERAINRAESNYS
jgi:hypothetical protein